IPQLQEAEQVSKSGVEATTQVLFADPERLPVVVTPGVPLKATPTPEPSVIIELPPFTPVTPSTTPGSEPTPVITPSVPDDVTFPSDGDDIVIGAQPAAVRGEVAYYE